MTSRAKYNDPVQSGQLGLAYHYEMLSDRERVEPFHKAIQRTCKGKIVIESGTGSGLLSILAARAGATAVYAVEIDPQMAECAAENFKLAGLDNVTILRKSTLDVTLADLNGNRPEVVIAENLSTWQATEPEIQVMNHITQHLAVKDAVRLPECINNYVELAESQFTFYDTIQLYVHYFEFTGMRRSQPLSNPGLFSVFDLRKQNPTHVQGTIDMVAAKDGKLNSLRLTSPLTVYQDIGFSYTDSLMPPVVVPLETECEVRAGDAVRVYIEYDTNRIWEEFVARAEKIDAAQRRTPQHMK